MGVSQDRRAAKPPADDLIPWIKSTGERAEPKRGAFERITPRAHASGGAAMKTWRMFRADEIDASSGIVDGMEYLF